ncbi:MAG: ClpXP protease specificity-enhancing factor SspB [Pseudomonadota bacterium]
MTDDRLRYDQMVERALRNVVRDALQQAAEQGLPGDHHFYLTFATDYPGVDIPSYLHEQYPGEMTIVLQYQFYGLEVTDVGFKVTLSFNNKNERLSIPLAAITTFADPSVNFALQFQALPHQEDAAEEDGGEANQQAIAPIVKSEGTAAEDASDDQPAEDGSGNVVTLDTFRKK